RSARAPRRAGAVLRAAVARPGAAPARSPEAARSCPRPRPRAPAAPRPRPPPGGRRTRRASPAGPGRRRGPAHPARAAAEPAALPIELPRIDQMSYFGCKPRLRYRSLLPFDLGVAVCAQQDAFPRFLTQLLDGPGHTAKRHLKVLGRGVDVVEVKRSGIAPRPAANTTAP